MEIGKMADVNGWYWIFHWLVGMGASFQLYLKNSPIVFQTFSFISPEKAHANESASFLCHHLHPNRLCYYFKWLSLGHILKGLITYAYAYLQHGLYLYSQPDYYFKVPIWLFQTDFIFFLAWYIIYLSTYELPFKIHLSPNFFTQRVTIAFSNLLFYHRIFSLIILSGILYSEILHMFIVTYQISMFTETYLRDSI